MNEDTLWEHIHDLEGNINNLERENKQLKERLDQAIILLAEWCIAVEDNGTSWDDWDTWLIHPQVLHWPTLPYDTYTWCSPDQVTAKYIGEAAEGTEQGVILASYNAG